MLLKMTAADGVNVAKFPAVTRFIPSSKMRRRRRGEFLVWQRQAGFAQSNIACRTVMAITIKRKTKGKSFILLSEKWNMSILRSGGVNFVGVRNLAAATAWYKEKLDLHEITVELDEPEECVALGFPNDDYAFVLGPVDRAPASEPNPLLFTSNIAKAREFLSSRGVNTGEIQKDRQGTRYFEMRDLEGNMIEVSEEP